MSNPIFTKLPESEKRRLPNPEPSKRVMRQGERRLFFQHIFAQMPLWEVWTREDIIAKTDGEVHDARDFKLIPRRLRRSMARARAKREWGAGKEAARV